MPKLLSRIEKEDRRYINIFGVKIPYEVEIDGLHRTLIIGPFRLCYCNDVKKEEVYITPLGIKIYLLKHHLKEKPNKEVFIKLFGKNIYFNGDRKKLHYQIRFFLCPFLIKSLMTKELTPFLGYRPDYDSPKSFNEKIGYLKLHDHDPLITTCADKYAVKKYISDKIGPQYVLPVLGTWKRVEDIDFDILPDKFVIKVNWSSGYNIVVKDKAQLNIEQVKAQLNNWMQPEANSYYHMFNWAYKDMKPVIFAEQFLEDADDSLTDYKFMCFNGKVEMLFVVSDRNTKMSVNFYDLHWNLLPFTRRFPNTEYAVKKPKNFDKMVKIAEQLSEPFSFVRVDFYESNEGKLYIGELTFYPGGGFEPFQPVDWDYKLGDMLKLTLYKINKTDI